MDEKTNQQYQQFFSDIFPMAYESIFPRASKSFRDANPQLFASQSEQDVWSAVVGEAQREEKGDERISVSIVMFRVRLLDPDNAYGSAKPLIDCLRACNLISGDSEKEIALRVTQEKVRHYAEQRTELKIVYP